MTDMDFVYTAADAVDPLCIMLNSALKYMERNMSDAEIVNYLGCNPETIDAIRKYDYEVISREG